MPRWEIEYNPRIQWQDFAETIVEIEAFRRSVLKLPLPPEFAAEFDRLNIVRQIKGTTGIEGNTLSNEQIEQIVKAQSEGASAVASSAAEQEVINAQAVLIYIRQLVQSDPSAPVTEYLIPEFHRLMTQGCDYAENTPGRYRQHNVSAGEYAPPVHEHIPEQMQQFVAFINSRAASQYGALIRAIVAHFYLISIHPFGDGNGRTSRALEAYILCQSGYNVRGFYSLANFFYRHRDEYITQLQDARFKYNGNLTEFVRFALDGYRQELEGIQETILRFVERRLFRDVYLESVANGQINARGVSMLEYLTFHEPKGIRMSEVQNRTHPVVAGMYNKLSAKTLQRDLRQLLDANLAAIRGDRLVANLDIMKQF